MELAGKVAIITGGGRGIGRAIALTIAEHGVNVGVLARSELEVNETVELARGKRVEAIPLIADVSKPDDVKRAVDGVIAKWGRIDILVNNAGFARFKPFVEMSIEDWKQTIDVNLTGTFLMTKAVVPYMIERREGVIINISSVAGLKPLLNQSAYCASKHGVNGLTTTLAMELKRYNIRVHAICPGGVVTRLSEENMPERDKTDWMLPGDVAHSVMYLLTLSPRATTDIIYLRRYNSVPLGG
ncbi:MAG: SDR family oxidoreductase [Candidatus Hydrogenedentes bacterium]|nr:SDR family oxidoreductase [Candidatus Hydrogenedentota bacterium]